jgi:3-methyladenine DNA glycosylase Mpg
MSIGKWQSLLMEPDGLEDDDTLTAWFDAIAGRLLCGCRLMAAGTAYRLTEVEMYYHGGTHLDPFSHRDPMQKNTGLWYFHRTHGVYRSGSFKGVDLTFGGGEAFGGILIRGIETEDGTLVDGPSLCVDYLLTRTGKTSVALLDEAIEGRATWDPDNPLHLQWQSETVDRAILKTARVGLSLKRARKSDLPTRFLMRPYRYLSEPRRIGKGKLHMVLALHAQGVPSTEIRDRTGCPKGAIERWTADYREGARESDFTPYFGIDLGPRELAQLHGLWDTRYGMKTDAGHTRRGGR